jgi:hypothetical protein
MMQGMFVVPDPPLSWVVGGKYLKQLLTVTNCADLFHYERISGNTDMVITTSLSKSTNMPDTGLVLLWELKRTRYLNRDARYQAAAQVVLANYLCAELKPIVALTDLRDIWEVFWLNGRTIGHGVFPSPGHAVALLNLYVQHAAVLAAEMSNLPPPPQLQSNASMPRLPTQLQYENRADTPFRPAGGQSFEALMELEGVLDPGELQGTYAAALIRQLSLQPAFRKVDVGHFEDTPFHSMYT